MKHKLFIILIMILINFKNYNLFSLNLIEQIKIKDNIYAINKISHGIDEDLKEYFGITKEKCEYSLLVLSNKKNEILQEIKQEDITDKLSLEIDNKIFKNLLKVNFKWNKFSTGPIGYNGFKFYKISENDGKLKLVFSYFQEAGMQDAPYAELNKFVIENNNIYLTYDYYEAIGLPPLGEGNFIVIYDIDKNKKEIFLNKIKSNVVITGKYVDGSFSYGDKIDSEYIVNPPKKMELSKSIINKKFIFLLKEYKFIY